MNCNPVLCACAAPWGGWVGLTHGLTRTPMIAILSAWITSSENRLRYASMKSAPEVVKWRDPGRIRSITRVGSKQYEIGGHLPKNEGCLFAYSDPTVQVRNGHLKGVVPLFPLPQVQRRVDYLLHLLSP